MCDPPATPDVPVPVEPSAAASVPPVPAGGPATAGSSAIQDAGLRCLNCCYNLTGLTENRCPECNTPFDPEELQRIFAGDPFPVPGWDDSSEGRLFVRFVRTCCMTWFRPTAFARGLPWSFYGSAVASYWVRTRVAALLLVAPVTLVIEMLSGGFDGVWYGLVFAFAISLMLFAGSVACELMLAFLLQLMVERRVTPRGPMVPGATWSWLGVLSYYGGFLILTAAVWPMAMLAIWVFDSFGPPVPLVWVGFLWMLGILLWWSWCLGRAIGVRAVPGWRLRLVQALIPVTGMISIILGVLFGGFMCSGAFR